jgi:hypothetical protein
MPRLLAPGVEKLNCIPCISSVFGNSPAFTDPNANAQTESIVTLLNGFIRELLIVIRPTPTTGSKPQGKMTYQASHIMNWFVI